MKKADKKFIRVILIPLFISTYFVRVSIAQPGTLDLSFNPGTGAGSTVYANAIQSDGKILIGGSFTSYNGTTINRIARLNSDGSLDAGFDPGTGANATVYTITVQSDGKILIGGDFTSYNGTTINRIARLNSDGSLDGSFTPGTGASAIVYASAVQTDDKIIIAGSFSGYNGTTRIRIARLNTNGTLDTGFDPGSGPNDYLQTVAIQSDGKIIIGGNFTFYAGTSRGRIARINSDGTLDTSFDPGSGTSGIVYATALQSDGKILAGGNFTSYNGTTANYLVRINSDGTQDTDFNNGGSGGSADVRGIALQPNGKIIITGSFATFNGTARNSIASLNSDGTIYSNFNPGTGANNVVLALCMQSTGEVVIGGVFTSYNGTGRNRIARISNQTIETDAFGPATFCEGTTLNISFSITGTFNAGNDFTAELSDETGSFAAPMAIGSLASTTAGNISATIPSSLAPGNAYRVRVVSDDPIVTGSDNGNDISINMLPTPNICLVTVDTPSTHNIIIWEKPVTTQIDSFFIYREITTDNYQRIASVGYDSLNEYHDYGADPFTTSYKYKVSALDTCGFESAKSDYHKTIHLQNLGSGNLQWTLYEIENTANPVTFYQVYRDDFNTNDFQPLSTTIPGGNSTYTDASFFSFPTANYVVDVNWSISCTPFRTTVNTTRSNLRAHIDSIGVGIATDLEKEIIIYPNPATENITIEFPGTMKVFSVEIINAVGQVVCRENDFANKTKKQIPAEGLAEGVYTLCVYTNNGRVVKRIILR